ncbi:hypothetical protein ACQP3F_27760, partial [Escherichia coli]
HEKKKTKRDCRTGDINANLSNMGTTLERDEMINVFGYRVLMASYSMPSFHMAWMEIYIKFWLCSPIGLIKLTNAFYLLKHRTKNNL